MQNYSTYSATPIDSPTEPVTLARAKQHLRVLHSEEDDLIQDYITAARYWVEQYIQKPVVRHDISVYYEESTAETYLGELQHILILPLTYAPNVDGDFIIYRADGSQVNTILSAVSIQQGGIIQIPVKIAVPSTVNSLDDTLEGFTLTYKTDPVTPTSNITAAILQIVGNFYYHRDSTPLGDQSKIRHLLQHERIHYQS